jgi:hypothetical protein
MRNRNLSLGLMAAAIIAVTVSSNPSLAIAPVPSAHRDLLREIPGTVQASNLFPAAAFPRNATSPAPLRRRQ